MPGSLSLAFSRLEFWQICPAACLWPFQGWRRGMLAGVPHSGGKCLDQSGKTSAVGASVKLMGQPLMFLFEQRH